MNVLQGCIVCAFKLICVMYVGIEVTARMGYVAMWCRDSGAGCSVDAGAA
jgi:hypothetical protein